MGYLAAHVHHLGVPTFVQLWDPVFLLIMVAIGILYTLATGPWRHRFKDSESISLKQKLYFWSGLACWYIADGSPLTYYGENYYFSMHMLQQSIVYLIMPPLLLLGTPGWLLRPAVRREWAKRLVGLFTAPLFALFFFNFIFSMYHIPMVMDALMLNPLVLKIYNAIFLIAAFQMWFPVFCPLPEFSRMSDLKKIAYIFLNGILLTPACALIIFASEPMYEMYSAVPPEILMMPMLDDQQLGGVIMKIVQEIVYGIALGYTFFRWYRMDRQKENEVDLENEVLLHTTGNANRA